MKKHKKNNKNRRVLLLLLMMIPTLALFVSSSYAWFTANKTVTVSTIDVNVEAQGGIQISVDGTNWKSIVSVAEIRNASGTYTAAVNQIPSQLEPVSSALTVDANGRMEMWYGSVPTNGDGDYILTATKENEANNPNDGTTYHGRFIAFDLFFRADQAITNLKLTPNSGVVEQMTDRGIKNSARIAFVNQGNTALGSTLSTIQALNTGHQVYLWEPNSNVHTTAATAHAFDVYGMTVGITDSLPTYAGVNKAITAGNNLLVGAAGVAGPYTSTVTPTYQTLSNFTGGSTSQNVFGLSQGITKMRIYAWIEGQDIDCENNASGEGISFNIQLAID